MKYEATIGLEVHTELSTNRKMFCDCKNDPDELKPNENICPVCMGHPGTLPVPNIEAIKSILRVGLALNGKIAEISKFDRKNYFYPDLPKGYQISQYDEPFVLGGMLADVKITRVHLEEDTGRNQHNENGSLIDFNRAGVPLMELVTEPVIHDAETAVNFAKELQLLLRYLGISKANMEKGEMRVEANISIAPLGEPFGTKVEVKNLNSFKSVEGAIKYEIERQKEVLERGEKVIQETRGWNESKGSTFSQRSKESAHDYRYFKEPDIPFININLFNLEELKASIIELPSEKRVRFKKEYGLLQSRCDLLVSEMALADYFEKVHSEVSNFLKSDNIQTERMSELTFNYLTSDLRGLMKTNNITFSELKFSPEDMAHLIY